jgi:16S rRNA processing protein RimM
MKLIALGVIGRPFGIRGELRMKPYNSQTTWFDGAEGAYIQKDGQEPVYYSIVKSRWHKDLLVLTLKDIKDRNESEKLKGAIVLAPEEGLEDLAKDEYYWYQLVGLDVYLEDGNKLGEIIRMEETAPKFGGHDVVVVNTEKGEIFVPATREVVSEIDIGNNKMVVKAILGFNEIKD